MEIIKGIDGRIERVVHRSPAQSSYGVWLLCWVTAALCFIMPMMLATSHDNWSIKAETGAKMAFILAAAIVINHAILSLLHRAWTKKASDKRDLVVLTRAKSALAESGVSAHGLTLPECPTNQHVAGFADDLSNRASKHWQYFDNSAINNLSA